MISQLASSTQYVPVIVTAMGGDPTADVVAMAFTTGTDPQPSDWQSASWDTSSALGSNQYLAQCLVGPAGAIQLAVGQYAIWVKVTDNPEIPILPAGQLGIY